MTEKRKYTSDYQGAGKRVNNRRKPRKKRFNKNGIPMIGDRVPRQRVINGEIFY